ncbi:MAG: Bax inhibitor-1/YccA family protein [Pseudomonadota bacterium]|jgi:modulator of FtsH protease
MTDSIKTTGIERQQSALATNRVLRNTYLLLALTLLFSAASAGAAIALQLPYLGPWITLGGYFLLLFLTTRFRNSAAGLVWVFALTGFMGATLGPLLGHYLQLPGGPQLVANALAITGITFIGLSAYAIGSRRDFSFLGGFLLAGILVAFLCGLAALFFELPALALAVSAMFVMLMVGLILLQTSSIIHGGETNYIMATVTLYVSIYNLFTSLLHLLGVTGED